MIEDDEYKAIVRLGLVYPIILVGTRQASYAGAHLNLGLELPDIELNYFAIHSPELTLMLTGPFLTKWRSTNYKWLV